MYCMYCMHVSAYACMCVFMHSLNSFPGPAMLIPSIDLTRKLLFAMRLNHFGLRLGLLYILMLLNVRFASVFCWCSMSKVCVLNNIISCF